MYVGSDSAGECRATIREASLNAAVTLRKAEQERGGNLGP